jgi:hypothetical protein
MKTENHEGMMEKTVNKYSEKPQNKMPLKD